MIRVNLMGSTFRVWLHNKCNFETKFGKQSNLPTSHWCRPLAACFFSFSCVIRWRMGDPENMKTPRPYELRRTKPAAPPPLNKHTSLHSHRNRRTIPIPEQTRHQVRYTYQGYKQGHHTNSCTPLNLASSYTKYYAYHVILKFLCRRLHHMNSGTSWLRHTTTNFIRQNTAPCSIKLNFCLLYTSPSPRDLSTSRMPSSA